jgi:hypothetical protein
MEWHPTKDKIIDVLSDGKPRGVRGIAKETGLTADSVGMALRRYWREGLFLRIENPIRKANKEFKGRAGIVKNTRSYYLYTIRQTDTDSVSLGGYRFVEYSPDRLDNRGSGTSKAQVVLDFLKENCEQAWFSTKVFERLKNRGVKQPDVMNTCRRYEKKGLVYVRGYRSDDRQTPFQEGYLLTWIDQDKPREEALNEAVERTDKALTDKSTTNSTIERVHIVRDQIVTSSQLGELVGFQFLQNKMDCSERQAEYAVKRALQLYPSIKEIKIFNNYRYYHHESMIQEELQALVAMKENYLRKTKGRDARVGHNWEACVEWFVDRFTVGAKFETQNHRDRKMDNRRITLHLLRSVGDRRSNAEVDRVWQVTPSVFSPTITYILECKYGVVRKRDVDEFFDVLRWSKRFGVDTKNGRELRQGIVGLFAGGTFNPKEKAHVRGKTITLAEYAGRMNIRLLKASDFNQKLHERGCSQEVTVQKICKRCKDEGEVRETLNRIWEKPKKSIQALSGLVKKNEELFEFEKMLVETREKPVALVPKRR